MYDTAISIVVYFDTDLSQVHVRKVKLLKSPKFDLGALLQLHGESNTDESGQKVTILSKLIAGSLLTTIFRSSATSRSRFWRACKRGLLVSEG